MLNILVVDDEKYIRKGLAATIKEAGAQFAICGEAGNGKEALFLIETLSPDVVITDIKMPKMDGVELVAKLNTDYPGIRKIILSGFDEFEYVRKSMKNGAVDYLLKPVDEERLKELLVKIEDDILTDRKKEKEEQNTQTKIKQNLSVIKEKILTDYIDGKTLQQDEDIESRAEYLKLPKDKPCHYIIIVSIDNYSFMRLQMPDEAVRKLEIVKTAVRSFAEAHDECTPFVYGDAIAVLMSTDECDIKSGSKTAEDIFSCIPEEIKPGVSLAVGDCVKQINLIGESYGIARKRLEYRFCAENTNIFTVANTQKPLTDIKSNEIYVRFSAKIKDSLHSGSKKLIEDSLNELAAALLDAKAEPREALNVLAKVYLWIEAESEDFEDMISHTYGPGFSYIDILQTFDRLKRAMDFTVELYSSISEKMRTCDNKKSREIIEQAKEYILNNYMVDLSLEKVADVVYINSNYLSEIFKCKTGENFVEYITRVRIEKAKKLLHDLEYKTYQVGQMVGYEDPSYFSKVFKKPLVFHQADTEI